LTPPPVVAAPPAPRSVVPKAPPVPLITPLEDSPRGARRPSSFAPQISSGESAPPAAAPPRKEPAKHNRSMWALFAVAGIVFAIGARMSRDRDDAPQPTAPPPAPEAKPAETA